MSDRYASLKQGLVGCWIPSVSGSGLLLPDLSGRGNNGSLVGMDASDWVSASYGRALDFDGVNDKVELGARDLLRQPLSISAWAYRRSSNANHTIIDGATDSSNSFGAHLRFTTANKIRWYFNNANLSLVDTTTTPSLNTWHHVTGTFDGVTSRIYLNGVLEASTTGDAFGTAAGNYRIGCLSTVYGTDIGVMDGLIDDLRIYSRALSESEIKLLASEPGIGFKPAKKLSRFSQRYTYNPPKARNYGVTRVKETDYGTLRQGLVGAWCPSLSNGGSGNTLPDVSGYNNHGSLVNMSPDDWVSSQYGRALDFDGVNDYVDCGSSPAFSGLGAISVSVWLKLDTLPPASQANRMWIVTKGNTSNFEFELSINSFNNAAIPYGRYVFTSYSLSGNASVGRGSDAAATTGSWINLIATQASKAGTPNIYLDGVIRNGPSELAGTPTPGSGTAPIQIGSRVNGTDNVFDGQLDDIRIYNRALTEPEIRLLASRPGIGLRQESHRQTFYQFPSGSRRRRILTGMP